MTRLLALALLAALGLAGWQWHAASTARAETAQVQQRFDAYVAKAERLAREASEANALETARRLKVQSEVIYAEVLKTRTVEAAAARNAALNRSVRLETDRLAARSRAAAADPASGAQCAAVAAAVPVLTELFGECRAAVAAVARYADGAHGEGRSCERNYDALKP